MSIDNYWFLVLAVAASAAVGAAFAFTSRRRRLRVAQELQRKTEVKSWENEGGNLAATPANPVQHQP